MNNQNQSKRASFLNKGISTPIGIAIIFLVFLICAGIMAWQIESLKEEKKVKYPFPIKRGVRVANPSALYCDGLGYEFKIVKRENGGEYGLCVFPNGQECGSWEFFSGKCGQEYSFCAKIGGEVTTTERDCTCSVECSLCVFPDGTECTEKDFIRMQCPKLQNKP